LYRRGPNCLCATSLTNKIETPLGRTTSASYDVSAFASRIDSFPNKSIGIGKPATTTDVLAFLDSEDMLQEDLYLWR